MLDMPNQNKMITNPPAKKEYHFAATAEHYAAVVYAHTIKEAEELYHKAKRRIAGAPITAAVEPTIPAPEPNENQL